jgi:lysophospholipase L1-like esterase
VSNKRPSSAAARRLPRRLLALLLGTLAALGAGELLVRLAGGAPEVAVVRRGRFQLSANPRLLYEPVPDLEWRGEARGFFEWPGRSNRRGFRDRDHAPDKPPGAFRIAVLGDSIAAGYQVERTEEAFPARLEELLRRRGHREVEVLNFGVTGYNTAQEVETLRVHALDFDPDLVLLAWCHNDRRTPDPRILAALEESQAGNPAVAAGGAHRALLGSALYRFVRYGVLAPRPAEAETEAGGQGTEADPLWPEDPQAVETALAELAALSRERGFAVLVAAFPNLRRFYEPRHAEWHD